MTRQEVFDWAATQYGSAAEYPWMDENAVLRRSDNRKWYAIVQRVRRDRIGMSGEGEIDVLNVKSDPILIGALRCEEGFHPAYHMNKEKWISIRLDGSVPRVRIEELIALSYALTGHKRRNG